MRRISRRFSRLGYAVSSAAKRTWRATKRIVKESLFGFVASALMLPGALAFATVLLVITAPGVNTPGATRWNSFVNRTPARACLYGTLIALGFCVLLGIVVGRRFARAESACPGPYDELCERLDRAEKRVHAINLDADNPGGSGLRDEAKEHVRRLRELLASPSEAALRWLLGTGYLDAWRRLHAVEETLLFLEPMPLLLNDAFTDWARLEGSSIPQREPLLDRLHLAVSCLSATAARYLDQPQTRARGAVPAVDPDDGPPTPETAAEARAALVQVRSAIDDFRDSRRAGIIRARNRLYGTVVFAGVTGCVLLYVAILSGAPESSIVAVAVFYLVGAVIGLFRLLQVASAAEGAGQEDYELGVVRLVHTPLFSGLAAIGGVVLVQLGQAQHRNFSLTTTFDLHLNPYGLVAAAIFGLAPTLLLSSLQRRIDQYQTDLSKSNAGQAPAAPTD